MMPIQRTRHGISISILILVSFLAYANAWPDNLAWDDTLFSQQNRVSPISLSEIRHYFTSDVWAASGRESGLYRPLLLVAVALDIQLFGDWEAGYHLVNILLHMLASVVVFGFIRHLLMFSGNSLVTSSNMALLSALVFAVHPIHTEVVNSIFNRSDLLVTLGMVGGLWWFVQKVDRNPTKAWSILSLTYLLVLLCKESGVVLPALAVITLWFTTPGHWQQRWRKCVPVLWLLIPLGIYLVLRINALDMPAIVDDAAVRVMTGDNEIPVEPHNTQYVNMHKLIAAIKVWFDALVLILWPYPLLVFHGPSHTNVWIALTAQLALIAIAAGYAIRKSPGLLLGLMFFYITILPPSRVVGGGDVLPHLAERYLYTPSVGIAIMLAFGLSFLVTRYSFKAISVSIVVVMMILTPLTWARNSDWAATLSLVESEYENGIQAGYVTQAFVDALLQDGKITRANALCDKHVNEFKSSWLLSTTCGQVYENLNRYDKAEKAHMLALIEDDGKNVAHLSLAKMFLGLNRNSGAIKHFDLAISDERRAFMKEYLAAEMLMQLYPSDTARLLEARSRLEKSLRLSPRFQLAQLKLDEINMILGAADGRLD